MHRWFVRPLGCVHRIDGESFALRSSAEGERFRGPSPARYGASGVVRARFHRRPLSALPSSRASPPRHLVRVGALRASRARRPVLPRAQSPEAIPQHALLRARAQLRRCSTPRVRARRSCRSVREHTSSLYPKPRWAGYRSRFTLPLIFGYILHVESYDCAGRRSDVDTHDFGRCIRSRFECDVCPFERVLEIAMADFDAHLMCHPQGEPLGGIPREFLDGPCLSSWKCLPNIENLNGVAHNRGVHSFFELTLDGCAAKATR